MPDSGAQGMKERVGSSFRKSGDFHSAPRREAFGQRLAGLAGALVGVGDDANIPRIGAAARRIAIPAKPAARDHMRQNAS